MTEAASLRDVWHSYGETEVLRGVDLDVERGSVMSVLGQSGCGKSTLLRVIAGFERASRGTVSIDGALAAGPDTWVPPQRRSIGYVSQDGSLFPHLSVQGNLDFGVPKSQRSERRAAELLEIVSLDDSFLRRWPHELSGGQQQRVALARTLATSPSVVLLDEPFSALDTDLRIATRTEVRDVLLGQGVTTILVTHDHNEALSFSDVLAVMVDGRLTQTAPPADVYASPADLETAALVGGTVVVDGEVDGTEASTAFGRLPVRNDVPSGPATLLARPDQLGVELDPDGPARARHVQFYGHERLVDIDWLDGSLALTARVGPQSAVAPGDRVRVTVSGSVYAFPGS